MFYFGTRLAHYNVMPVNRKVLYRLYPTPKQELALRALFEVHRNFYNNARQLRINAWKQQQRSVSFADQCHITTQLRVWDADLGNCNAQSLQVDLKRLDLAFKAFFRRVKAGEKPGFPRYKTEQGFKGWGYKAHGNGWQFDVTGKRKATLKLAGVGTIKTRGKARNTGVPKTMEIIRRNGKWYASVTILCEPVRAHGKKEKSYDWGTKTLLTTVDSDGAIGKIENPKFLKKRIKKLKTAQNKLNKKVKGSNRSNKLKKEIANIHEKVCNQRTDHLHKVSATLVAECKVIITEELAVKSMVMDHSKKYSRSLHRSILDTAPATLNSMVSTKAQEAACYYHEVKTKIVKPTQRCSECWNVEPKDLGERTHICKKCGFTCDRDVNAALVMLKTFKGKGLALREAPGKLGALKRETPSIAANAA